MSSEPQAQSEAIFTGVVESTVQDAKKALSDFTNITWQNQKEVKIPDPQNSWTVTVQAPEDDIGKLQPTDLAITLTIIPPKLM